MQNETIVIYRNYGCLGSEKRPLYTYQEPAHGAAYSERLDVQLPDDWKMQFGTVPLVKAPNGRLYHPHKLIGGDPNKNNSPCFSLYTEDRITRYELKEI